MSTQETLDNLSKDFENAVNSQNVTKLVQLYTDKPRFLPAGGDISRYSSLPNNRWSKEYISTYWQNVFQVTEGKCLYIQNKKDFEVLGDAVYEIGMYDFRKGHDEGEFEPGAYFILWQKENGQWKIAVHVLNSASRPKWSKSNIED
jgi:ketosteroid isomerase-like protein